MYLFSSAPMTLANQHFVLCPDHGGAMKAEAVYATSAEAAVEMVQGLYKVGDFGEPLPEADVSAIRIATGTELPWNDPTYDLTVMGKALLPMRLSEALDLYESYLDEHPVPLRLATYAEREDYFRAEALRQDIEGEHEFNYGFNVLYKEQLEASL